MTFIMTRTHSEKYNNIMSTFKPYNTPSIPLLYIVACGIIIKEIINQNEYLRCFKMLCFFFQTDNT